VLEFSFPVLLLDEVLKFVARNYIDGTHRTHPWRVLMGLLGHAVLWCAYFAVIGYPYMNVMHRFAWWPGAPRDVGLRRLSYFSMFASGAGGNRIEL
jgi:hypothetical protein